MLMTLFEFIRSDECFLSMKVHLINHFLVALFPSLRFFHRVSDRLILFYFALFTSISA